MRIVRAGRPTRIRANEKKAQVFDADAEKLGLTRGAFFEKRYDAFKTEQGDKRESFLLQALATPEMVTPETLLKNMFRSHGPHRHAAQQASVGA
jgi:hypothetical protein